MNRKLQLKKQPVLQLGFSPLANHVSGLTKERRNREGVYLYQGVEIASVFDLVTMSREAYKPFARGYQVNTIRNWINVFQWAVEDNARALACRRYLETDHGTVEISKRRVRRGRPTYYIAVEDFPIYLEALCRRHPIIGQRLKVGWEMIRRTVSRPQPTIAFNF